MLLLLTLDARPASSHPVHDRSKKPPVIEVQSCQGSLAEVSAL